MVPHLYKDWLAAHLPGAQQQVELREGSSSQQPRPQSPSLDNMMNVEENPEEADNLQEQFNALSLDQIIQMTS